MYLEKVIKHECTMIYLRCLINVNLNISVKYMQLIKQHSTQHESLLYRQYNLFVNTFSIKFYKKCNCLLQFFVVYYFYYIRQLSNAFFTNIDVNFIQGSKPMVATLLEDVSIFVNYG